MPFRPRILVLPIAAAIISVLVVFKVTQVPQSRHSAVMNEFRSAPSFVALDLDNKLFKLERYIGRHEILVIFFDGELGADRDPMLQRVRERFSKIKSRGTQVVAISAALPQHNRQAVERSGKFPFPVLSDPEFLIHRMWGRYDENEQRPLPAAFLIDRAGRVPWTGQSPRPEVNLDQVLPPHHEKL